MYMRDVLQYSHNITVHTCFITHMRTAELFALPMQALSMLSQTQMISKDINHLLNAWQLTLSRPLQVSIAIFFQT